MNAIIESNNAVTHRVAPHTTHKMKWLLKREFWENKGGFFWAPVVASAISLLTSVMGLVAIQFAINKFRNDPNAVTTFNGVPLASKDLDLSQAFSGLSSTDLSKWSDVSTLFTALSGFWPLTIFAVVVFFYLLGALYDERKDRSVLFWKSLPVSDSQTVWSKVLFALVAGPLLAIALSLALMLATGLLVSVFIAINGGNPFTMYWAQLQPGQLFRLTISWLPIYILWALPTAGWLLLCSAWAKSKPFLWAILLPVGTGLLLGWFELLTKIKVTAWFWEHVVARMLLGMWPGSHLMGVHDDGYGVIVRNGDELKQIMQQVTGFQVLSNPSIWIGAVAGIAMIFAAIRLRRIRDDA